MKEDIDDRWPMVGLKPMRIEEIAHNSLIASTSLTSSILTTYHTAMIFGIPKALPASLLLHKLQQ